VLREQNIIEIPILIGNENLVTRSCSLLALAKSEVSILSEKGIGEILEIIDLRHINKLYIQKKVL
jgi:hypothetical protein